MTQSARGSNRAFWIALAILGTPLIVALAALAILAGSRAAMAVGPAQASSSRTQPTTIPVSAPGWQEHTHAAGRFSLHYPAYLFELAAEDDGSVLFSRGLADLEAGLYENFCQMGVAGPGEVLACLAKYSVALARYDARGLRLVHKRLWSSGELEGYEVEYLLTGEPADLRVTTLYVRWDEDTMIGARLARPVVRTTERQLQEQREILESFISSIRVY